MLNILIFTAYHFVLSLVAGVSNKALAELMPAVPSTSIVRAVPLPPSADSAGALRLYGRNGTLHRVLHQENGVLALSRFKPAT